MLNRLAELVESAGGTVDRSGDELWVHTTGYDTEIDRVRGKIAEVGSRMVRHRGDGESPELELARHCRRLSELETLKEEAPAVRTRFVWLICDMRIRFSIDGADFFFDAAGNPFFHDTWGKKQGASAWQVREVQGGAKSYWRDGLCSPVAEDAAIDDAAGELFRLLVGRQVIKKYA